MSNYAVMPITDYSDTCDAIREKIGSSEVIKSGDMSNKISEVYEAGKTAEYDRFWDDMQEMGKRGDYSWSFCNTWTNDMFRPKYDMYPHAMKQFMNMCQFEGDLDEHIKNLGIVFNTRNCTNFQNAFSWAKKITKLPPLDIINATTMQYAFTDASELETITLYNCSKYINFNGTFWGCYNLKNLEITGVIGYKDFIVKYSSFLTHESLMNIINALENLSGTTEKGTVSMGTTNLKKLTDTEKAIATEKGWTLA